MTDGLALFRKWMGEKPERTQTFVAALFDINQSSVSAWLRGVSRPEPEHRVALRALAGIPEEAWLTRREARRLKAARTRISGAEG